MRKDLVIWIAVLTVISIVFLTYYVFYSVLIWRDREGGTRFVMFSCLHVGETSKKELDRASNFISLLKPNYVISAGDFLSQERNPYSKKKNDMFMEQYLKFLGGIGAEPEVNAFHVSGGVHDGWDSVKCGYYDGMFRRLNKYSDMDMVKIGNLAFFFLSEVRGGTNYRITRSQLDWLNDKLRELSIQDYNVFIVKHTSLHRTTAYTDRDGDFEMGAWTGVDTPQNREESDAIKSLVNQYDNVVMIIQGHVHIDATDKDDVGRSAFMNWEKVYGDPRYLGIKAHVLNCAGISTTMHSNHYKSYQNIWFMDFIEGKSFLNLYASDIDGRVLLRRRISLPRPFESGSPEFEQQWSPSLMDYPNTTYPNSLSANHKILIKNETTTFFNSKFRFDENVAVKGVKIVASGNGSISNKIAYSDDGVNFSKFSSKFPLEPHRYWTVRVEVIAESQMEIFKLELITSE